MTEPPKVDPAPARPPSTPEEDNPQEAAENENRPQNGSRVLHGGWVLIKNKWGKPVSRIPSVVVGGRWIALPYKACLGGDIWLFRPGQPDEATIQGGLWREGYPVGLWSPGEGVHFDGPPLKRWSDGEPLEWLSLKTLSDPERVVIETLRNQGPFFICTFDRPINEAGLLLQGGSVVGWTFNPLPEKGVLWNGSEPELLTSDMSVDYFYTLTFAHGREESFSEVLAMGPDTTDLERLDAFAESFRFTKKLTSEETPEFLSKRAILQQMHSLASRLIEKGSASGVADILTGHMIMETAGPVIFLDSIHANAKAYGIQSALDLFEQWHDYIRDSVEGDLPELTRMRKYLYSARIAELLKEGEIRAARRSFDYAADLFPDDAALSLLGAEVALAEGDLNRAERLFEEHDYPPELLNHARALEARIKEGRAEEGKIVIRFRPNSRQIPVNAILDRRISSKFFIDTGASMVTIPWALAEKLGITITRNHPRRRVTGVGGEKIAPEVVIREIELNGWTEYNVPALVLDIQNRPDFGLLGLNFLERFHMELNSDKGLLMLKPK